MNLLAPPRRFDPNQPELMDRPETDPTLLREELQMLEYSNRHWRGHRLVLKHVEQLLDPARNAPLSILDLGTGIADIPRVIVDWARRRQLSIIVTAVDRNPVILQAARESCRDWPEIRFEQHDLLALPYAENSFDIVLCSLALHHCGSADAVAILRNIRRFARCGYIVNDLRRNWLTIMLVELAVRRFVHNPVMHHDARASIRAGFTVGEFRAMAQEAGLTDFRILRNHLGFRMSLIGRKRN